MKKIFLFIIFTLYCTIDSFGQIQRKFFGLELGVSSRQEVLNVLKTKGLNIVDSDEDKITALGNIRFGGYEWTCVHTNFLDQKLQTFTFLIISNNQYTTEYDELCKNTWEGLKTKLKNKYIDCLTNEDPDNNTLLFEDNKTKLATIYHSTPHSTLGISYIDSEMYNSQSEKDDDEL